MQCCICMNTINDAANPRVLVRCKHVYCSECLTTALAKKGSCPLCRAAVVKKTDVISEEVRGCGTRISRRCCGLCVRIVVTG